MSRYTAPLPDEFSPRQRALYAAIVDGPRKHQAGLVPVVDEAGRLLGPFALMTIAPEIGDAVQSVGAALRFSGAFAPRTRELAILTVAVHRGSDFEWFAHVNAGRDAGLTDAQLRAIQQRHEPGGLDATDACVWRATEALLAQGRLDDEEYAETVRVVGAAGLAELVWLIGYYSTLQLALATFDPALPADVAGVVTRPV
ncbi:carboxymuconolactone decarboxylase family protein [Amycolatopsis thermophila]|uniref:Alkylhydroperoxidase family enzyme n=1 Tax=Amycolatopsis thermophila TaxID=206084 RepID=A0ABU0EYD0_9PSEU|nr:carboxymuconolactone decarboxylase family protein [Amycolatopsis thermophila]MDQ0380307.1 alkylhydroperoxidase family enzyme [Amycolatopsis thermophila]